jgi:hypothetical protein
MQLFGQNTNSPFPQAETDVFSLTYHGWRIEILRSLSAFTFKCYPPDLQDFIDSGEEYSDQGIALREAYAFVDREIAIRAILEVINEWFWQGLITEDEYWNLTNFA